MDTSTEGIFNMQQLLERAAKADKDAIRFRWLLDGHGYFMEEEMLCGHAPVGEKEKDRARLIIDQAMKGE